MPRRPPKKSKGGKPLRPVKRSDAKLNRWQTTDDIPLDEEDAFHASKDKILLGGDVYDNDDDGDDDEVFALKGLGRDDDESYEAEEENYEDDGEDSVPVATSKSKKGSRKNKGKQKSSDEEEEEEEAETWGSGKAAYYSSNAAQLESDDEEGHELEEQEAKRLQKKALEGLSDDDFGLNDIHDVPQAGDLLDETEETTQSILPALPKDKRLLLRHLGKTNPEALALARDWDDTVWTLMKTRKRIAQLQLAETDLVRAGMAHLHYQALSTYATVLAFYLHLRTSPKYAQRPELLTSHPIMQRLLTLKQSVSTIEDLGFTVSDSEPEFDEEDDESLDLSDGEEILDNFWQVGNKKGLEPGELDALLEDAELSVSFAQPKSKPIAVQPLDNGPPKKKRKLSSASSKPTIKVTFDLEEPEFTPSNKKSQRSQGDAGDAYGEATHLQDVDAADKSARKKTLRFHTSKIESTSTRRRGARKQAMGGDDDIPYRERKKEKDARLLQDAGNKVQNQGGEDLDDSEPPQLTPKKRMREDDSDEGGSDDPDGYYELVKKKSRQKKVLKKAEYEIARAAERGAVEETVNSDGPRSLTRAILTNRGLTPHRSKSVRNPRVKKRQKYEKAKKKLASQKAIYKGGLASAGGRYEGEKSGISKVIKSIKLG